MSQLNVVKASAGSGKTFILTREFLRIILSNPLNFSRVLAVTFTNKATGEMKARILKELADIAMNKSSDHAHYLLEKLGTNNETLALNAQNALSLILNQYSFFSVGTIDSFFQKVIRAFASDLSLPGTHQIELNTDEVLEKVVKRLLSRVQGNTPLLDWLMQLADNNLQEGKSYDFRKALMRLAGEVFKEQFKQIDIKSDKSKIDQFVASATLLRKNIITELKNQASDILYKLNKIDIGPDQIAQGRRGVYKYISDIANGDIRELSAYAQKAAESIDNWLKKDSPDRLVSALSSGLFDTYQELAAQVTRQYIILNSIDKTLQQIYNFGITEDIKTELIEYCQENELFLLADASYLIYSIIDHNDSPFIFEKLGNIYRYFMIDEFQDTSEIQWANFKPLLVNSLASGYENLVVGDVKQSIYRWRNSSWKILASKIKDDFPGRIYNTVLKTNYRSNENIIQFNNHFFETASDILQNHFNSTTPVDNNESLKKNFGTLIKTAYHDTIQNFSNNPDKRKGYVSFIQIDDNDDWKSLALTHLIKTIEDLQDRNLQLKDIAILVRTGKEGKEIANALIEAKNSTVKDNKYRYDFISNDSLYLSSSYCVKVILSTLKLVRDQNDLLSLTELVHNLSVIKNSDTVSYHDVVTSGDPFGHPLFPKYFRETLLSFNKLHLYTLTENIIHLFGLWNHREDPYLLEFMDVVTDYTARNIQTISGFLNWWDENQDRLTINLPENKDAINILTIHKSKGLQFEAVLIPFSNWNIDHDPGNAPILWCHSAIKPFDMIEYLPIIYSKKLEQSIFINEYLEEKIQSFLDNLNLVYVAFTRSKSELHVTYNNKAGNRFTIAELIDKTLSPIQKKINFLSETEPNVNRYSFGEKTIFESRSHHTTKEFNLSISSNPYTSSNLRFTGIYNILSDETGKVNLRHGKFMHRLFSEIKTIRDIRTALVKCRNEGVIKALDIPILEKYILNKIECNQITKSWFDGDFKILSESEIMSQQGEIYRPDRIMINKNQTVIVDYKFGHQKSEAYKLQLINYINLLKDMKYDHTVGYIWYVELNDIEKVDELYLET